MRLLVVTDRPLRVRPSGAGAVLRELVEFLAPRHELRTLTQVEPTAAGRARWEPQIQAALHGFRPDLALTLGVSLFAARVPVLELLDGAAARSTVGGDSLRRRLGARLRAPAIGLIPTEPSRSLLAAGRDARVLPVGVDTQRFAPDLEPVSGPVRLVFLGRLIAERGAHAVVEAVQGLPTWARERMHVDLVGAAEDPRYLDTLRRRAEGGPITVHPDVCDVLPFLQRAQLAVLPSTAEDGWGRALLECMAVGLPVVYSKGGVLDVLAGGAAIPIAAGNLKPLGECLRELLRHPEALPLRGQSAREHAVTHHSWAVVGPRWESLLAEVAEGRRPG